MEGLSAVVLSINNDPFLKLITRVICVTSSGSVFESRQLFQVRAAKFQGGDDISSKTDSSWPYRARTVPSALTPCCLKGQVCTFATDITTPGLGDEFWGTLQLSFLQEAAKTRKIRGADTFRRSPESILVVGADFLPSRW